MIDTPPAIAEKYRAKLMALSPVERLKMGCRMFHTAVTLVRASVQNELGATADPAEIRRRVLTRLYGNDFSPQQLEAIARNLR